MARQLPMVIPEILRGYLAIEEEHPGYNSIYFIPSKEALKISEKEGDGKTLILEVDALNNYISIHPTNTLFHRSELLKRKYLLLETITLDGFDYGCAENKDEANDILQSLPASFVKDYNYGLGLKKDYRFLIEALEELAIQHLIISKRKETKIDEESKTFTLNYEEYEWIRRNIDKVTREAQKTSKHIKRVSAHNGIAYFLKDSIKYPQRTLKVEDTTLSRLIAKSSIISEYGLTKRDQKEAVKLVSNNRKIISKDQPEALIKLHNDIELVSLEVLIEKYAEMLAKKAPESVWQKLFTQNPFILSLAFSSPIVIMQGQAYVGGTNVSGSGDKIPDFLATNSLSYNSTIIEIKKPSTDLLNKKPYRGSVYVASSELAGSLNQVLDQRMKLQNNIHSLQANSRDKNFEVYHVQGVLIIGVTPEGLDEKKSFEIFRGNSKDVTIITFDELLDKLKQLHRFLTENKEVAVTDKAMEPALS